MLACFFFFNDTATTEIYTLSLHDALPISDHGQREAGARRVGRDNLMLRPPGRRTFGQSWRAPRMTESRRVCARGTPRDRKSTRLNSSHLVISYAVFCLKKKKNRSFNEMAS